MHPLAVNLRTQGQVMEMTGVWKAWKAMKSAFHPSHTPWKSLRDFAHSHGFDDDCYIFKTGKPRRKPASRATFTARGVVNHVPSPECKQCPGTLTPERT
jgi:hypothetical protein